MAAKSTILKAKIEGALVDLMVKSNCDNIVFMDGNIEKTLATKLSEIITQLGNTLTNEAVDVKISEAISDLIDGAPETYNTLKEIADYIASHEDVVTTLNEAIGSKVDKIDGKGLSTNDFTNEMKALVEAVQSNKNNWNAAYTHSQKEHAPSNAQANVIEIVKVNGKTLTPDSSKAVDVSVPTIYTQTTTPSNLKDGDLFIQIVE